MGTIDNRLESEEFGGKAAGLSRLREFGVEVPPALAISKSVFKHFQEHKEMPKSFLVELESKLEELKSDELIVRSSAIGEDSDSHSFAGQLDSFVVQNSIEAVRAAIFKCWESLENDRVLAYQKVSGKVLSEMGVVVQEFLDADYAGVTFTQSPVDRDSIYTEYVRGAGEQLVSGKVSPKNFSTTRAGKLQLELPFNANELVQQSLRLKDQYECHLDIEWVSKKGQIYFVQARPITVDVKSKVHWTNTNLNENYPDPISPLLYSIARDSYYHYFKNMAGLLQIHSTTIRELEFDFSNSVGIWANRIYYNMTSIHNILSSSPLKNYFKDAFNQFVGYNDKDVASVLRSKKTSLLRLISRLIGLNFKLESHVKEIENKVSNFSRKVDFAEGIEEYSSLYYEFLDLRFNQWYHASLADFFSMIHYKLLGKFTKKYYGDQSVGVHNVLIQAIPGLMSSEPLNDTWDLTKLIEQAPRGRELFLNNNSKTVLETIQQDEAWEKVNSSLEDYLNKWGFRCSGELMFFKKNYIEEPERFIELLQSYMKNSAQDPREVIEKKARERKIATRKFAGKIFLKRHILLPWSLFDVGRLYLIAKLCKQAISSRERVRYKQAEMYYKFKVVTNEIGKHAVDKGVLEQAKDILYLDYKEIGELTSSSNMFGMAELIKERKLSFAEESNKEFPQHFATNFGERPDHIEKEITLVEGATEFEGLAASGGRVKARVKVLESVLEGEKLNKGDILVTKQTDPGWAMVFPIIGGLIVERGGALSHGAIVAREFGIPAVIGIDNITKLLKDNDEVILDGDLGKVQIL
ncbi:MAG: phosphohistidine swiveling domain-containing protein [Parvicellaceae bacterium]